MEQIRFYFDEHIPAPVAEGLTRRGVDVLTVQEAARAGLPDAAQLAYRPFNRSRCGDHGF